MRSIFFALAALAVATFTTSSQAVTISVMGGGTDLPIGSTGQLEIHVDTSPENTAFNNGGIELRVHSSNPGVVQFTAAEVTNPKIFFGSQDRWTTALVQNIEDNSIGLLRGASVGSPGLTTADPANTIGENLFLFATIDYTVTGAGLTEIILDGFDGVNDFVSTGTVVVPTLVAATISGAGDVIPEPGSMILASMGLIGLVLRRRNG